MKLLGDPDLRRHMGRAGRQRLLENFTQRKMHEAFAMIYDQMQVGGM